MGCNFQCDSSLKMNFTIPESGHKKDFEIFYHPDFRQQKSVVRCEWFNEYECFTESGFNVRETDDKYALITLPDSLKQNPGKFYWQISGLFRNDSFCSWIPKEICQPTSDDFKLQDTVTTAMPTDSSSSGDFGSISPDDNTSIIIGTVVGALVITLILVSSIVFFRRHRRNKCLRNPKKLKIFIDEENALPQNKNVGSAVGDEVDDSSTTNYANRSKRDSGNSFIDEKRPFLRSKEDSTQKKSEHKNKSNQGKFCDMDAGEKNSHKEIGDKNSDEGFESKDSDDSFESKDSGYDPANKTSVTDSDKKKIDDGYVGKQ
ncbi:uncharacterized protein LOC112568712 [Pomacea canaliculata]|uniref:uncharacterized protein LOC112568712 n=1 Tax=Pomacea canaliculata TaxID=400727 RepID=UPI000D73767F|nr:uncharacterized protein LOC112568712 [Pomacea canaliculata]XP_025101947.1 uncharacterized protein LOC112568712 [Pomacea canaliculata]